MSSRIRKFLMMLVTSSMILFLIQTSPAYAGGKFNGNNGKPFRYIRDKIGELEQRVQELENNSSENLHEVYVDCASGESVNNAIQAETDPWIPLIINIHGICEESLTIDRDDVTIRGTTVSDGLSQPLSGASVSVITVRNAIRLKLNTLSLSGGLNGVDAGRSTIDIVNVDISNASTAGIIMGASNINITDSRIANNVFGVISANASRALMINTLIENNIVYGIWVPNNGNAFLAGADGKTVIRGSQAGALVETGGSLFMNGAIIENNANDGIIIRTGATTNFFAPGATTYLNYVQNNGGNGLFVGENSSVLFTGLAYSIIGNGGFGIACVNGSTFAGIVGTVTGNSDGDIDTTCD